VAFEEVAAGVAVVVVVAGISSSSSPQMASSDDGALLDLRALFLLVPPFFPLAAFAPVLRFLRGGCSSSSGWVAAAESFL